MIIARISVTLTLLLLLTLPLSAFALWSEAELKALIAAAEKEVAATPAWQKGDSAARKRLTELAVRQKIINTAHSGFDPVQMLVDRKIDEILEKSLSLTSDKLVNQAQKQCIREMFKEEMFKYFVEYVGSELEGTYKRVRGSGLKIEFLMGQSLRGNKILEKEIGDILENINERMGAAGAVREMGIIDLQKEIYKQFGLVK